MLRDIDYGCFLNLQHIYFLHSQVLFSVYVFLYLIIVFDLLEYMFHQQVFENIFLMKKLENRHQHNDVLIKLILHFEDFK